ncbi:MAG: glycosyltransferase [Bacteroidota bacterium]|nr:glycosyltransferase [Bacteroidota bacterium]
MLFFYIRLLFYKKENNSFSERISIIICAKNEAENLTQFLPKVLEQKYENFEVILVDDQSKDNTEYVLKEIKRKYFNLRVVKIEHHVNSRVGKKFALTLGIKAAKYEYLLLTDADCVPVSENWLSEMVSNFSNEKQIVLGYGAYKKEKGLLNKMIRFDAFSVAMQYFSYALAGIPYMGVGRNLAYKKSVFFDNKGFASHIHMPSGDDDLFVQEVANKQNVVVEISADSHSISETKQGWKEWFFQRRRHMTTSEKYNFKHKILLGLWPLSQFLFWLSFGVLLFFESTIFVVFLLFIFRILIIYILYYSLMKKLRVSDLLLFFPLFELLHLFIQGIFVLLNSKNKPTNW